MTIPNSSAICCPKCESGHIRRIPRSLLIKHFLGFIPLRRYQCLSCLTSFSGPVNKRETTSAFVGTSVNLSQPFVKQTMAN